MEHVFAYSYGRPFVGMYYAQSSCTILPLSSINSPILGKYTPPPCEFDHVTINFTVTSRGRQFDRLGLLYLGDIEVFRTSTAEPTKDGIVWSYVKEMNHYSPLWKREQKIIFDLGNLINDVYTGTFNTTLTATFFTAGNTQEIADIILPISARRSSAGQGSAFSVPAEPAIIVHEFPLNIERAVVSLAACGQADEEFWYSNVLSSRSDTFSETGSLNGYSSFREIQLWIDDRLAGVVWPFPIIFTGGIAPGLWRPIVGIDAFDLRENQIDITPFVPQLCDGQPHVFQIKVVGLKEDGVNHASLSDTVGSSWTVSGKIFLFLNKSGHRTTGFASIHQTPAPHVQISSRVSTTNPQSDVNDTLVINTHVNRHLYISNLIATPDGFRESWWRQDLLYSNFNKLSSGGKVQFTSQSTTGFDQSKSDYETRYNFPLTVHTEYEADAQHVKIDAVISRARDVMEQGPSVFPAGYRSIDQSPPSTSSFSTNLIPKFIGDLLWTTQTGNAHYQSGSGENKSFSFGSTEQEFSYRGINAERPGVPDGIYYRKVGAVNSTVREDRKEYFGGRAVGREEVGELGELGGLEGDGLKGGEPGGLEGGAEEVTTGLNDPEITIIDVRRILGRGPRKDKSGNT